MTTEQFKKYCKRNKPTSVTPEEYSITFTFRTKVVIIANHGIDGMIYTKWKKPAKWANKALLTDLMEATPMYLDSMIKKYSLPFNPFK